MHYSGVYNILTLSGWITAPSHSPLFFLKIFFPRSYEAEYRANNTAPPSESPESPPSNTNHSLHVDSYHHHKNQDHTTASPQSRLKSKLSLAIMAKELRQTPVKRVLSHFRVRVPMPLRRKTSQLSIASDVTPFSYPNEPASERGRSSSSSPPLSAARSGRTYLLTDSPILEATKELPSDDVELFVLDGTGSDVGVVCRPKYVEHRHRHWHSESRDRKGGSSSPPPPRYEAGSSRHPAVDEPWTKRRGTGPEFVVMDEPHFIDPDAVLSLPQIPYSPVSSASASALHSSPPRNKKQHQHRQDRSRTCPATGDGSNTRHRRSNVPQMTPHTGASSLSRLTAANVKEHNHRMSKLNPLVLSFSSPLDVAGRNAFTKTAQPVWV